MLRSLFVLGCCLTLLGVGTWTVLGEEPKAIGDGGVSTTLGLKGQLEKGLRARRPVEFKYLAEVVKMVEDGDLPRSLVDSSFLAARKRKDKPLQYFQFVLQARASKVGIVTPALDNQVVILR